MTEQPFKKVWKKGGTILAGIDGLLHGARVDATAENASPLQADDDAAEPELSIREFMTHEPVTVRVDTPLHRALELLIAKDLSALPVVDENGEIVGLLNERHVLMAVGDPEATTLSGVMDTEPVTIGVDEPLVEIVDRLMAINVRQVLVLESSTLVGVVTRADLMPAVLEMLRKRAKRALTRSTAIH